MVNPKMLWEVSFDSNTVFLTSLIRARSFCQTDELPVVSLSSEGEVCVWDGLLSQWFLGEHLRHALERAIYEFCRQGDDCQRASILFLQAC